MEVSVIAKEKQLTAAEYLAQERKGIREKDGKDALPLLKGEVSLTLTEIYKNLSGIITSSKK